jgi:hypothetical protein
MPTCLMRWSEDLLRPFPPLEEAQGATEVHREVRRVSGLLLDHLSLFPTDLGIPHGGTVTIES